MRMIILSCVRNEADIIEAFVRHHARIAERMIIVCHRCTDGTETILHSLQEAGLPLDIRSADAAHHAQASILSDILGEIRHTGNLPDILLPLDADEFLHPIDHAQCVFSCTPTDRLTLLPWRTYVPTDGTDPHPLRRIHMRRTEEGHTYYKAAIPGAMLGAAAMMLDPGNHGACDARTGAPFPSYKTSTLHLAHFPVRGAEHIRAKVLRGSHAVSLNAHRGPREAFHWFALAQRLAKGHPLSMEDVTHIALRYALPDDVPTPALTDDPLYPAGDMP